MNKTPLSVMVSASLFGTMLLLPSRSQSAPPADPFVKEAGGAAAAAKAGAAGPWQNCMLVLEVYVLDQDNALAVLESEHGPARYRRVTDLAKNGKARLEILTAVNTKSGQRAMVESNDEVIHPVTFQTRNAGDAIEFEPVMSADGRTWDLQIQPQRISFQGFREILPSTGAAPIPQPFFSAQKLIAGSHLLVNEPQYLGSLNPPSELGRTDGGLKEMWLAFARINVTGPTADELKPPAKPLDWSSLNLDYSFYSLDRAAAREILAAAPSLDGPWKALEALQGEKKARFEHLISVKCRSQERSQTEEVLEEIRRTPVPETDAAKAAAPTGAVTVKLAAPDARETRGAPFEVEIRNAGMTIEVEPIVAPDGLSVDVNLSLQSVTLLGDLKTSGAAARYPAQPVSEVRGITTSETVLAGRQMLLGTFNPPGADGVNDRVDAGRTWLVFVRAMPNEP